MGEGGYQGGCKKRLIGGVNGNLGLELEGICEAIEDVLLDGGELSLPKLGEQGLVLILLDHQ